MNFSKCSPSIPSIFSSTLYFWSRMDTNVAFMFLNYSYSFSLLSKLAYSSLSWAWSVSSSRIDFILSNIASYADCALTKASWVWESDWCSSDNLSNLAFSELYCAVYYDKSESYLDIVDSSVVILSSWDSRIDDLDSSSVFKLSINVF